MRLWAELHIRAQGGDPDRLLSAALEQGIRLRKIRPIQAGFCAVCPAERYVFLKRKAKLYGGQLKIIKKKGAYFCLRGLLKRGGLWAGILVWGTLLFFSRNMIWFIQYPDLPPAQQIRAAQVLRSRGIQEGAVPTQEQLAAGEAALVQELEYAWASLNFQSGRLCVELAYAAPVPAVKKLSDCDLVARVSAQVVETVLEEGTLMVRPGDAVTKGQTLIERDRKNRKEEPVYGKTAGKVVGRFVWRASSEQSLVCTAQQPQSIQTQYEIALLGKRFAFPILQNDENYAAERWIPMRLGNVALPACIVARDFTPHQELMVQLSETLAVAKARLVCLRQLQQEWPDHKIIAQTEQVDSDGEKLIYQTQIWIEADICMEEVYSE